MCVTSFPIGGRCYLILKVPWGIFVVNKQKLRSSSLLHACEEAWRKSLLTVFSKLLDTSTGRTSLQSWSHWRLSQFTCGISRCFTSFTSIYSTFLPLITQQAARWISGWHSCLKGNRSRVWTLPGRFCVDFVVFLNELRVSIKTGRVSQVVKKNTVKALDVLWSN